MNLQRVEVLNERSRTPVKSRGMYLLCRALMTKAFFFLFGIHGLGSEHVGRHPSVGWFGYKNHTSLCFAFSSFLLFCAHLSNIFFCVVANKLSYANLRWFVFFVFLPILLQLPYVPCNIKYDRWLF